MSNSSDKNQSLDLSALDFGPAWARDKKEAKSYKKFERSEERSGERKGRGGNGGPQRDRNDRNERGARGDNRRSQPRFERPAPRQRETLPEGITASIMPVEEGVDNLVKQIAATGRTYSVFDLARIILKSRDRYNIAFSVNEGSEHTLFQATSDQATFFTQEECLSHFAASAQFSELYNTVEVEVDAPKGNFPSIACCGFSGDPIAPPNYHAYQALIAERHAADFANMPLDKYKSRINTERDEAKVATWLESMKKQTQYQLVSDTTASFTSKSDALQHFKENGFSEVYPALKKAFVKSDVSFNIISSGLATGLLETISDQNRYPGNLASFLCRQLSGRHLAVYKWQSKLHAGPSRPHVVPEETPLAVRPKAIYEWAKVNSGKGIDALWAAVLPTEISEEEKTGWFHDLHWMLNQGYLVLLENGSVHLSSDSKLKPSAPKGRQGQAKAKGKKKPAPSDLEKGLDAVKTTDADEVTPKTDEASQTSGEEKVEATEVIKTSLAKEANPKSTTTDEPAADEKPEAPEA